jgi:release factor glutamine methyltransferase
VVTAEFWISGADLWAWRQTALQQARVAEVDAQELDWLLAALGNVDRLSLRLGTVQQQAQIPLACSQEDLTQRWQQRLHQRVPVQYLVGETPWRNLALTVSPAVLIPRPETELIIDLAAAAVARSPHREQLTQGLWVDMGTGSGAIAIALAQTFPAARILAVDLSPAALAVAQANADRAGFGPSITFYQGSWFDPLVPYQGQISALVSNPPYIPSALLPTLQPEVIDHEPATALDGGPDGLTALGLLVIQAADYLVPGGLWLAEIMAGQGEAVQALLTTQGGYRDCQIHLDLAGRDRFVQASYAPSS